MTRGFLLGKFYPPHAGHHQLIDRALQGCDELVVLVMAAAQESIPVRRRVAWLQERHPTATVRWVYDEVDIDYHDSAIWDAHDAIIRSAVPETIDVVFSCEEYGEELARRMNARHVHFDAGNRAHGISATQVRADPPACWSLLTPAVRSYLAKRVIVVGAESTGTTTLTQALAQKYHTAWVPEYGRQYSEEKLAAGTFTQWAPEDFTLIAAEQSRQEDDAARSAGPVVFGDTDAFATCIWEERYLGATNPVTQHIAAGHVPDLYLLTSEVGVVFEAQEVRDGEHLRAWMNDRFRAQLDRQPAPWLEVTGTREQRLAQASAAVDQVLADGWHFAAPRG